MSLHDHIPLLHSTFACQGIGSSHFFEAQGPNAPSTGTWQRSPVTQDPSIPLPVRSSQTCLVSFGRLPADALFLHRWEPNIPTSPGEKLRASLRTHKVSSTSAPHGEVAMSCNASTYGEQQEQWWMFRDVEVPSARKPLQTNIPGLRGQPWLWQIHSATVLGVVRAKHCGHKHVKMTCFVWLRCQSCWIRIGYNKSCTLPKLSTTRLPKGTSDQCSIIPLIETCIFFAEAQRHDSAALMDHHVFFWQELLHAYRFGQFCPQKVNPRYRFALKFGMASRNEMGRCLQHFWKQFWQCMN